jgi:hypothetical protein
MAGALVGTNILQTAVSMALSALRERIVLAKVANRDYEGELTAARRFATVNISVPAAIAARAVAPDVVPPAVTALTPTSIPLTLDQWYEAPFAMDDKGLAQIQRDIIPQQLSEAVRAIVNQIDGYLWGLTHGANGFYGYSGVAGTSPFGTGIDEFTDAARQADTQLMPAEDRTLILDPFAYNNAIALPQLQSASWRGNPEAFRTGQIGEALGATWEKSQNVPRHTSGTWTNAGTTTGTNAAGQNVVNLTGGTGSILVGDIVTFAGADTQTYVVTEATGTAPTTAIKVAPNLKTAKSSTEVVTVKASHRSNLLIQRYAMAFAMAPLIDEARVEGVPVAQAVAIDADSGLALRLEVTRQHRQYQWALDALWGGAIPRRDFGVRIAGI